MPGAPLIRLAVAVLLAAAPMRVAGATLVPGGGGRRTDCIMQMSAEGVGFPAGKTPKGVSCADGDVCDLDGQRNGVCLFGVSLCLNQPTRSCQPRSVNTSHGEGEEEVAASTSPRCRQRSPPSRYRPAPRCARRRP